MRNDNNFNDFNDFNDEFEDTLTFQPQQQNDSTFKQRNDPEPLLHRFRLEIMNAYEREEIETSELGGDIRRKKIIKIANTTPRANKEGIEDIISYMRGLINSHTVQGNIVSLEEYRLRMKYISQNITQHFLSMRVKWGVEFNYVDLLITKAQRLADLILTRLLENEERKGYGESYKESTSRSIRPEDKKTFLQKASEMISGRQPTR